MSKLLMVKAIVSEPAYDKLDQMFIDACKNGYTYPFEMFIGGLIQRHIV